MMISFEMLSQYSQSWQQQLKIKCRWFSIHSAAAAQRNSE